ncbi:MAG: hypothetical protein C4534_00255 [Gaiellales bacterium]|nr:MAG: hypothetical protein C4534_00255 [Gaiellales bacterium]
MGKGTGGQDDPRRFGSRSRWREWLRRNHAASSGAWLVIAKKHAAGLHYEEAVEEALCFGWIDSTVRRLDGDHYRQWYSPRKADSAWSNSNRKRVERLTAEGRMARAGLESVRVARENGSWNALETVEKLQAPADLVRALAATQVAGKAYEALPPSHRKQYLFWINSAKRPGTRERRIRETVERLVSSADRGVKKQENKSTP